MVLNPRGYPGQDSEWMVQDTNAMPVSAVTHCAPPQYISNKLLKDRVDKDKKGKVRLGSMETIEVMHYGEHFGVLAQVQ